MRIIFRRQGQPDISILADPEDWDEFLWAIRKGADCEMEFCADMLMQIGTIQAKDVW